MVRVDSVIPAVEAARARASVIVLDEDKPYDLFELVELGEDLARVRSPFLFEIGEELAVRIERDGRVFDAQARVRAHVGPADARVTELEISLPVSR